MTKQEQYEALIPEIESILEGETDVVANMANIAAVIHETFGFWWTGFYRVMKTTESVEEELVLGPFQGPLACTRIKRGRGVCGTSWQKASTIVVPNVHEFPGHIACSSASNSEIVVPIIKDDKVMAVLDIDSKDFSTFDNTDAHYLEKICHALSIYF